MIAQIKLDHMKPSFLLVLISICFLCTAPSYAQLSPAIVKSNANAEAEKWSQYLNLSKLRTDKLASLIQNYELKKGRVVSEKLSDIESRLRQEETEFRQQLGRILTTNELKIYDVIEQSRRDDDRQYLSSVVGAISEDSIFQERLYQHLYEDVLPTLMTYRAELNDAISESDRKVIDEIRDDVMNMHGDCLLTCIDHNNQQDSVFINLRDLIIVNLNKAILVENSSLSRLVDVAHKYEDDIHQLSINHAKKYASWSSKIQQLKEEFVLPNYQKNIDKINRKNDLSTLRHLETEAIFLLIDPYDQSVSRRILNLGVHNYL